jgi:hypothetical protein
MNISAIQYYLQLFSVYLANVITTFTSLVMDHFREVTTSFIKYNFEINEGGANDSALIASWY